MKKQTRGRPRASEAKLGRDKILDEALALLAEKGFAALGMRALARRLGTDPMALYHYFPDKGALLAAAADRSFASLRPRERAGAGVRERIHALARAYLRTVHRSRELLLFVTASGRASASFDAFFFRAIAPLHLSKRDADVCRDALADLLHGAALAGPGHDPSPQIDVLLRGFQALA
ncbi:MAG: TetR/AcrR family transcriptional regulator [Deltaproteobacteria bacterium]|nr:TetR/AcrR family transcriptional regulator [Deltaproteobacteria bacterium]